MAVDDHSRIAFEKATSSASFLREGVAYFARLGIAIQRVMTDNGPCFYAGRFRDTSRELLAPQETRTWFVNRGNGPAAASFR